MKRPVLSKEEQAFWMLQHIRTRMFAVMASRAKIRELQSKYTVNSLERYDLEHIFHATWEGQHAALRWLIEFAGIKAQTKSNVVTIECFDGGELILESHEHYQELLEVWALCSEVTSHPTMRKRKKADEERNPLRIPEKRIHNAASVLKNHFKEIYAAGNVPI